MSWIEVGDDIFCIRYEPLDQTIGAIRTGEGLVVLDSRSHRLHAEELLNDLRSLDARSPVYLINTHYHWDHSFGNAQFTGATIVGHHNTRDALVADGEQMKAALVAADWLSPGFARLIGQVEITPPTITFADTMALFLGGREILLSYLGRAHTDSDIVITVDDVVFAGDLIEVGAPPSFGDSFPSEWVDTLGAVAPMCTGPVVPGHGDVVERAFVEGQQDEIRRAVAGEDVYPDAVMAEIRERLTQ